MRRTTRLVTLLVLALGVLAWSVPSHAVTYHLNNSNTIELAGIDIHVDTGTDGSGNTTLTVQLITNPLTNTPLGIDQFFYNTTVFTPVLTPTGGVYRGSIAPANDITSSWENLNFDGTQADGFGNFNSSKNADSAGTDGISAATKLIFVLNGTPTFTSNGSPNFATFAAHIRYDNNCSGWVSDGTDGSSSSPGCAPVPEPGTLALVGSGLVSLGMVVRKRLFNRRHDVA